MNVKAMVAGLLVLALAALAVVSSTASAAEKKGAFIESVTVTGPSSCSQGEDITVTVTVKAKLAWHVEVKLYEDDVVLDDKIGTKTIDRKLDEGKDWEESVTFTFRPSKYEKSKTLELYAKAGDAKSNTIKVKCK